MKREKLIFSRWIMVIAMVQFAEFAAIRSASIAMEETSSFIRIEKPYLHSMKKRATSI